jgi:hypothetical protein
LDRRRLKAWDLRQIDTVDFIDVRADIVARLIVLGVSSEAASRIRVNLKKNREYVVIVQTYSTVIGTMFQNLSFKLLNAIRLSQREDR